MSNIARLEDFAARKTDVEERISRDQLTAEYARGYSDGESTARADVTAELANALQQAAESAKDNAGMWQAAVGETLQSLAPVIRAIAGHLAANRAEQLAGLLLTELEHLALSGVAPRCTVSAEEDVIHLVQAQIEKIGLEGISLVPAKHTEITFDAGKIVIDPDEFLARIDEILAGLSESEEG
ncbi:hypothetical protein [Paracoccus aerodenitrificans]|uniref:hypothetical protein n=1 Tax=Paracoccus aerodenitrificans TaxID=3017781 RepID=UPI0022F0A2D0|nr:hypothetical protein [Paracoccus aerodenitrificans]WBU63952.1 hypothetical protein PAE61_16730 [Paracoccus aerodenitrificans]